MRSLRSSQIPPASVSSLEDDASSERGLHRGQDVVAVDPEALAAELMRLHELRAPMLALLIRAGAAGQRFPLARGQAVAVADQLERRAGRIASAEEPGVLRGRLGETAFILAGELLGILRRA